MQVRSGFSIIEMLVAMVIAFIVLTGLLLASIYAINLSLSKAYMGEATRLLHEKLEELHRTDYDAITPALNKGATSCKDALESGKNVVKRQIRNRDAKFGLYYSISEDPGLSLKKVNLDVCWSLKGKFHQISGSTVVRKVE